MKRRFPWLRLFAYLYRNALFAAKWQLRKTKQQSRDDYEQLLAEKAEPILIRLDRALPPGNPC